METLTILTQTTLNQQEVTQLVEAVNIELESPLYRESTQSISEEF